MLKEQFKKLLLKPLLDVEKGKITTRVIVIDALDECDSEDDIQVILRLLPQVQQSTSVQLRFLLTSRPELTIRLGFTEITGAHQDLILHEVPKHIIEQDISLFLEHKLSIIRQESLKRRCEIASDWAGGDKFSALVTMSVPLFIFAATVCRIFEDPQWHPADSLKEILLHQNATSNLDGTYLPVLNRLCAYQTGGRKEKLIKEYRKVIGTVLLEAPLPVVSLSKMTGVPYQSICFRLDSLHSVLSIPSDENEPIRPFHLSFRDFLLDLDTRKKTPLWIEEREMQQDLTIQCLHIMHSLKKNICNLPSEGTQRNEIDRSCLDHYIPPELQYSCRYWAQHLLQSQDPVAELIEAFHFSKSTFFTGWK